MYAEPMPMTLDDSDLLARAAAGSREALAEIARRYVGFVYAAALRQVRDPHLAEDVTQAVFVILARKVRHVRPGTLLHGWLFATTRYAAANAIKLRARRQFHERRAAAMRGQLHESSNGGAERVEPFLDDALAALRSSDRDAVLLSYMAGKSWREVAAALGTTEEAARKRVTRAVAQLRDIFARRGVVTTGAAVVAAMTTSAQASPPPALLAGVNTAIGSTTIPAGSAAASSSLIVKGALHTMTLAKVKIAAAAVAASLGVLGGAGAMVMQQSDKPRPALQAAAPGPGAFAATLENGVTVELMAVSRLDDDDPAWWNADGSASDQKFNDSDSQDDPPHSHQVVVRVTGADSSGIAYVIPDARGWSAGPARQGAAELQGFHIVSFRVAPGATSTNLRVNVAAGEWETLVSHGGGSSVAFAPKDRGSAAIGPLVESNGQAVVTACDLLENHERRIVVVDHNGNEPGQTQRMSGSDGKMHLTSMTFPLPADEVAEVRFMARPFDQFVEFKDVSLQAGKKTEPKVEKGK